MLLTANSPWNYNNSYHDIECHGTHRRFVLALDSAAITMFSSNTFTAFEINIDVNEGV